MSANDAGSKQNDALVYHGPQWKMSVKLHNGINVIKEEAFQQCTSLRKILTPPSVRAIKDRAFNHCLGLTTAILNDGLEEIGVYAFSECMSLVHITIPPYVRVIKAHAFENC
jgi:hypothetical protein